MGWAVDIRDQKNCAQPVARAAVGYALGHLDRGVLTLLHERWRIVDAQYTHVDGGEMRLETSSEKVLGRSFDHDDESVSAVKVLVRLVQHGTDFGVDDRPPPCDRHPCVVQDTFDRRALQQQLGVLFEHLTRLADDTKVVWKANCWPERQDGKDRFNALPRLKLRRVFDDDGDDGSSNVQ
eukprot:scaffold825_cov249-Pinguiococcus_pyrenoidosus.AAC.17